MVINLRELRNQVRQECFFDASGNGIINPKIIVDDPVSETSDALPVDGRETRSEFFGQAVGGFADDFEVANHRIQGLIIFDKLLEALFFRAGGNLVGAFQNVADEQGRIALIYKLFSYSPSESTCL